MADKYKVLKGFKEKHGSTSKYYHSGNAYEGKNTEFLLDNDFIAPVSGKDAQKVTKHQEIVKESKPEDGKKEKGK